MPNSWSFPQQRSQMVGGMSWRQYEVRSPIRKGEGEVGRQVRQPIKPVDSAACISYFYWYRTQPAEASPPHGFLSFPRRMLICCAVLSCHVWFFVTSWTVAHQVPLSMGILQARILERVAMPSSRGSFQLRDRTQASCIAGGFFSIWTTREAQEYWSGWPIPPSGSLPDPGIEPRSPALQVDYLSAEECSYVFTNQSNKTNKDIWGFFPFLSFLLPIPPPPDTVLLVKYC